MRHESSSWFAPTQAPVYATVPTGSNGGVGGGGDVATSPAISQANLGVQLLILTQLITALTAVVQV